MSYTYKGKYQPSHPQKYKGNPLNIVYRSLWERKFMVYCDRNENILEWASEEIALPYRSPVDNRLHRYFPDFYIKYKDTSGKIKTSLIEIKPKRQCSPPKKPNKQNKSYIREVYEYAKNQSKWEAAREYCDDRGWEFKVLTERELNV